LNIKKVIRLGYYQVKEEMVDEELAPE